MKHTPGPWNVRRMIPESSEYLRCIKTAQFEHIAHVCDLIESEEEARANAALIAAAPDLLDALQSLADAMRDDMPDFDERQWPEYRAARAALLKACPQGQELPDTEN